MLRFFCFRVSSFPFDGRNPANQFRLVVYPILYKVLWPSKRWLALGFLNHQSTVSSSRVPSVGTRNCHQLGLPNICAACAPLMMRRVHRSTKLTFRLARLALLAVHRFDVLLSMMSFLKRLMRISGQKYVNIYIYIHHFFYIKYVISYIYKDNYIWSTHVFL